MLSVLKQTFYCLYVEVNDVHQYRVINMECKRCIMFSVSMQATYCLYVEVHDVHQKQGQANQNGVQPPVISHIANNDAPHWPRLEHFFPSDRDRLQFEVCDFSFK